MLEMLRAESMIDLEWMLSACCKYNFICLSGELDLDVLPIDWFDWIDFTVMET